MGTCDYQARIGAFFDEELGIQERLEVGSHVLSCPVCQAELASLKRLSRTLAEAVRPEASAAFMQRLHRSVQAQSDMSLLRTAYTLLAVAASLFLGLSLWAGQILPTAAPSASMGGADWESYVEHPQAAVMGNVSQEVVVAMDIRSSLGGDEVHE